MHLSVCSNKTKHCLKVGRVELKGLFRASQASHGASTGLYILLNFAASCDHDWCGECGKSRRASARELC